jgi:hypothetical protein
MKPSRVLHNKGAGRNRLDRGRPLLAEMTLYRNIVRRAHVGPRASCMRFVSLYPNVARGKQSHTTELQLPIV